MARKDAPRVEWRFYVKGCLGRFSSGKGRWDSARLQPRPPDHRLEAYATMLSGVSSDLSKYFLRGVPRTHATV